MLINFDEIKPSASMEITKIANGMKKEGKEVYTLSIGDTHFPPPNSIVSKINDLPASYSHYGSAQGLMELREQIAKKYKNYTSESVIIVPGLKQGIYYSLQALKNKKVCILEPAWLGYKAAAILANYDTEPISLNELDWLSKLEKSSFDTLIICSPNNPNGKIFTEEETKNITKIAKKNDAWIIADLIYERYSYNLNKYNIFLSNISKYFKLIIANGFSKSHAMTGFRIGYLLIKDDSIKNRILLLQQNIATCPSVIAQQLLINFNNADKEIKYFYKYYLKNRGLVLNIFPEWENQIPEGGFYYFINLNKYGVRNANIFCKKLLINTGVALVPGEAYGDGFDSFVRISFSNDTQKLKIALSLLREFLNKWV